MAIGTTWGNTPPKLGREKVRPYNADMETALSSALQETRTEVVGDHGAMREKVQRWEDMLATLPQVFCPTLHHFGPGVYVRQMIVPAGTDAVGAVHKTEHLTVIAGHCLLTTDEGPREFIGVEVIRSAAGTKRVIRALETTVVLTIHPTEETDTDRLVELLTESKASDLLEGGNNKQALNQREDMEKLK